MDEVKTSSAANEYRLVDVEELKAAGQEIIRHMQKEAFKEEISNLKKITADYGAYKEDDSRSRIQKPKGASPLSCLDPFRSQQSSKNWWTNKASKRLSRHKAPHCSA